MNSQIGDQRKMRIDCKYYSQAWDSFYICWHEEVTGILTWQDRGPDLWMAQWLSWCGLVKGEGQGQQVMHILLLSEKILEVSLGSQVLMDILGSLSNSHWPPFFFNCPVIPDHRSWACISIMIQSSLSTYCVGPMPWWWEYRGEQAPHETYIQAWSNKQANKTVSLYLKYHDGSREGTAWRTRLLGKRSGMSLRRNL